MYRWIFGMYCRTSRITILYAVPNRKSYQLLPHLKKHVAAGSAIFSDEAPAYVNLLSRYSKIVELGKNYFHFWTNHSAGEYTHPKFRFNSTQNMEYQWARFKSFNKGLFSTFNLKRLQRLCDYHSLKEQLISERAPEFILKCVRDYQLMKHLEFQSEMNFEQENVVPTLYSSILKEDRLFLNPLHNPAHYITNVDYEDIVPVQKDSELNYDLQRILTNRHECLFNPYKSFIPVGFDLDIDGGPRELLCRKLATIDRRFYPVVERYYSVFVSTINDFEYMMYRREVYRRAEEQCQDNDIKYKIYKKKRRKDRNCSL